LESENVPGKIYTTTTAVIMMHTQAIY